MRRITRFRRFFVAGCALVLVITAILVSPLPLSRRLRSWVALSQAPPARFEAHMYVTYQFHVLKNPTGLLLLKPATGGVTYFHLFIADSGNHVIRKFTPTINALDVVAGTLGSPGYADGRPGRLNYPAGMTGSTWTWWDCPPGSRLRSDCIARDYQTLYINDSQNYVMRKLCTGDPPDSAADCDGALRTVCGTHNTKGYADGASMSSCFASLAGLTAQGSTQYVVDAENHCIRTWDGANVTTFAGYKYPGFVNGYRTAARFNIPGKATFDTSGNMYVADIGNNAIRKIDSAGNVTTRAGGGPYKQGKVNAQGTTATFFRPTSVVYNSADTMLYVADSHNNCIRRIDSAGNVTTYAGTGTAGLVNGPLLQAQFSMPTDLVIYGGYMYVADSLNNCIRRIDMVNGQVSTYVS